MRNLPKINELYSDIEIAKNNDLLTVLLNQEPKRDWIKVHPYIRGYQYLPIDKIEFLLKKIFKQYRIEILREGVSFNGVYVVVRVHYLNPVSNEWDFHDGIGASQLQTSKGKSPAELENINNGAISMAYPVAKTVAIKDACDHFGKLFGSDLNRKETLSYSLDKNLHIERDIPGEISQAKNDTEMNQIWRSLNEKEQIKYKTLFTKK